MKLKVYENSTNYTAQVIKLPAQVPVQGLDNLVKVTVQGNDCLIQKGSDTNILYLFFPAEAQISNTFLKANNLYRESTYNSDPSKKGFFDENGRVRTMKFKGVVSQGFIIPASTLPIGLDVKLGDEFNAIDDIEICKKYIPKGRTKGSSNTPKQNKLIHKKVESKFVPEHTDTAHLMKEAQRFTGDEIVAISRKIHGTSSRYYNAPTKRPLSITEKIAKFFGIKVHDDIHAFVCASRRCIKSVNAKELPNSAHWYKEDLWTKVGKELLDGKLNHGEAVYAEIIGKDYLGADIQPGYTYGFDKPKMYIYRITNINPQGIEVDLPYEQMKVRATQLGIETCPELFYGKLSDFMFMHDTTIPSETNTMADRFKRIFYDNLLEKPSILDKSVIEEGFVIRVDSYPKPYAYKIKSKTFALYESGLNDKGTINIEDERDDVTT